MLDGVLTHGTWRMDTTDGGGPEGDHLSCSLVNAAVPGLFNGGVGLVVQAHVPTLCSYARDVDTMHERNGGCSSMAGSWRPREQAKMMRAQLQGQGGNVMTRWARAGTTWYQG